MQVSPIRLHRIAFAALLLSSAALGQVTTRVSWSTSGAEADEDCDWPTISDDGQFVAFTSRSTTLSASDPDFQDVFLRDRVNSTTIRVSGGTGANTDNAYFPSLSADGALVVFESRASNLVAGDTNGSTDVFLYDRGSNSLSRLSVDSAQAEGSLASGFADISPEGDFVAFASDCTTFDSATADLNMTTDIFLRDRTAATTRRISVVQVGSAMVEGNGGSEWPSISANGSHVAFASFANNFVTGDANGVRDVYCWDSTGAIVRVSAGPSGDSSGDSFHPSISGDGRYVAYWSAANDLLPSGSPTDGNSSVDVFLWDRVTGTNKLLSVNLSGTASGNGPSSCPSISRDGSFVSFRSVASDLVDGDTNGTADVFAYQCSTGRIFRVSIDTDAVESLDHSEVLPRRCIDGAGAAIVFQSESAALDLDVADTNAVGDVFVRELCGRPFELPPCPSGTSINGCQATMSASGVPSASANSGFWLTASNVEGARSGFVFYSPVSTNLAYGPTSRLCVKSPSKGKSLPQFSGGNAGQCNGTLSLDWCAFNTANPWTIGQYPNGFTAGVTIYAQAWYRDPATPPFGAQLSNSIAFGLCP